MSSAHMLELATLNSGMIKDGGHDVFVILKSRIMCLVKNNALYEKIIAITCNFINGYEILLHIFA